MFYLDPANTNIVVTNSSNPVFTGSGLVNGSALTGLLGYEVDNMHGSQPANTVQLAHSPLDQSGAEYGDMTLTAPSGATVFDAGSMQFIWGLNDDPLALRPSFLEFSSSADCIERSDDACERTNVSCRCTECHLAFRRSGTTIYGLRDGNHKPSCKLEHHPRERRCDFLRRPLYCAIHCYSAADGDRYRDLNLKFSSGRIRHSNTASGRSSDHG